MKGLSAALQWDAWRTEGKEPKTRIAAIRLISQATGRSMSDLMQETKRARSKYDRGDGSEKLSDLLSFIVWDVTENGNRIIESNNDRAWFQAALVRASNIIYGMAKVSLRAGKLTVRQNVFVSTVRGATRIDTMKPMELTNHCKKMLEWARMGIAKWKAIGLNATQIILMLRTLLDEEETALYGVPMADTHAELRI